MRAAGPGHGGLRSHHQAGGLPAAEPAGSAPQQSAPVLLAAPQEAGGAGSTRSRADGATRHYHAGTGGDCQQPPPDCQRRGPDMHQSGGGGDVRPWDGGLQCGHYHPWTRRPRGPRESAPVQEAGSYGWRPPCRLPAPGCFHRCGEALRAPQVMWGEGNGQVPTPCLPAGDYISRAVVLQPAGDCQQGPGERGCIGKPGSHAAVCPQLDLGTDGAGDEGGFCDRAGSGDLAEDCAAGVSGHGHAADKSPRGRTP
mmetsp:Transcript_9869/g.28263  ORF Transcript_9869/g.28263 Transcript_9869/m.28263 type:complete len:254 (-) Transcript_9869:1807-2568(-)